jgi:hypothetical protein
MSSGVAVAGTSLPRPLTIEFHVITQVYAPLSKPSACVSVASGKAYEAVSHLVTECVAEV